MNKNEINSLLDKYMEKNSISNKDLEFYLKEGTRNFDMFIKRNKLTNQSSLVSNIIIEKSNNEVLTLDKFKQSINEDFKFNKLSMCLYIGIEPPTIEYEKVLVDYFDTNLSNVSLLDKHRNMFEVSDWGINKFKAIIYHKDDFNIIHKNIIDYMFSELSKKSIEIIDGVNINLRDILNGDIFKEYSNDKIDDKKVIEIISDSVDMEYIGQEDEYFIWSNKKTE